MPEIQRVSLPYHQWEDYGVGMYALTHSPRQVIDAQALLADPERLRIAMQTAVASWPNAALHQMSNPDQNRRAWLGWAACMINNLAPANATKVAWSNLSDAQRKAANNMAEIVIHEWEQANVPVPATIQPGLFDEETEDA
jgi:hypothetical protein